MAYAQDFRNDTQSMAQSMAKSAAEAVVDTAAEYAQKAGEKLDQVKADAGQLASDTLERGREAGRQLDAVATNMRTAVDKSLRDQPMATLAVATLAGFVLGALWKS